MSRSTAGTASSAGLNEAQREAVETLSGPLLILAGAGTGKTRVITHRIVRLIRHGVAGDRIWAVTFTNKAAREMRQRITKMLGRRRKKLPVVSTFHAYCVQILRRHATVLGLPRNFVIYDQGDQDSLARRVLRSLKMPDTSLRPSDLTFRIGQWKSRGLLPSEAAAEAESDRDHLAATGYRRYQKALDQAGAVDFDDLLLCTGQLLDEHPDVCESESERFDHILVDEYQDTNGPQYRIVRALAEPHRNLCVVGDDDQSIYGWRGADVTHILRFTRDWPDAKVVRLEHNYRCTGAILKCANQLIANNPVRARKVLRPARPDGPKPSIRQYDTPEKEAEEIVGEITHRIEHDHLRPGHFAILCRTNEQPRVFETALRKARLPYVLIGSRSFFDRREVKDLMAYLRLLVSPRDEAALRRIINTPSRGIGETSIDRLLEAARSNATSLWSTLRNDDVVAGLSKPAQRGVGSLTATLTHHSQLVRQGTVPLAKIAMSLVDEIEYRREIEHVYETTQDRELRWGLVEEFINAIASFESDSSDASLNEFLDQLAMGVRDPGSDKEDQLQQNAVVLMTLHSAKGLEFPIVYLTGMEEGILPHRRSIESPGEDITEERRLCYVGITRAQEELIFSLSLTRRKWGKVRKSIPSRFLFEAFGKEPPKRSPASSKAKPGRRRRTRR